MYRKSPQKPDLEDLEGHGFKKMYKKSPQKPDFEDLVGHGFKKVYQYLHKNQIFTDETSPAQPIGEIAERYIL